MCLPFGTNIFKTKGFQALVEYGCRHDLGNGTDTSHVAVADNPVSIPLPLP